MRLDLYILANDLTFVFWFALVLNIVWILFLVVVLLRVMWALEKICKVLAVMAKKYNPEDLEAMIDADLADPTMRTEGSKDVRGVEGPDPIVDARFLDDDSQR